MVGVWLEEQAGTIRLAGKVLFLQTWGWRPGFIRLATVQGPLLRCAPGFDAMRNLVWMLVLVCLQLQTSFAQPSADKHPEASAPARRVIVVCPPGMKNALADWVEWREEQGYQIEVLAPAEDANGLQESLRRSATSGIPRAVLLVGKPYGTAHPCPVCEVPAEVNVAFGSTPTIATDSPFVDFDSDGIPDCPLGRIPVAEPDVLKRVLARSMEYEHNLDHGAWRRRINLVAGVGGFNPALDQVIEGTAESIIRQMMPEQFDVSMTWGNWSSPYCPDPARFSQTSIERFNEGCLFWVYIGHGFIDRLDRVKTPATNHVILDPTTVPWMSAQQGPPIALMLCCFTAAFDARMDCLAQTMLEQPRGPVAVIGGTRMTMPYGMGCLSMEMMSELFGGDCETVGDLLHLGKVRSLQEVDLASQSEPRQTVEAMARAFSPIPGKLDVELREHVAMMHLLGDPLLKLERPLRIPTRVSGGRAGETMVVSGEVPSDGQLVVEACYRRGRFWNRPQLRKETDLGKAESPRLQADYERCRDLVCSRQVVPVTAGTFRVELPIPERARGEMVIRTFLEGRAVHAVGMAEVDVEPLRR